MLKHGEKIEGRLQMCGCLTMCFRKVEDERKITRDHSSTPFRMDGSLRTVLELRPMRAEAWRA